MIVSLNVILHIIFQEPTKKPRNPTPVTNPDRGSHYLKKSPSPTGTKDPPTLTSGHNGTTLNTADEYLQRKAMLTCGQQVKPQEFQYVLLFVLLGKMKRIERFHKYY